MSYSDVTINTSASGQIFKPYDISNKRVLRKREAVDTFSDENSARTMEIAHTESVKGKPARHMLKFGTTVLDSDKNGGNISIHVVITVDPGVTQTQLNDEIYDTDGGIGALLVNAIGQCDGAGDYVNPTSILSQLANGFPL